MTRPDALNQTEHLVLLALARLGEEAYGVTIRREIEARTGRAVSTAAVYAALDRLERAGLVRPWLSDPLPERGGRARRHFQLRSRGAEVLRAERAAIDRLWDGLDLGAAKGKAR